MFFINDKVEECTRKESKHAMVNCLFNHIEFHTHTIIQAGVISAKGVSTTDTGIAFRKISK